MMHIPKPHAFRAQNHPFLSPVKYVPGATPVFVIDKMPESRMAITDITAVT
jgi:hypothetical protein